MEREKFSKFLTQRKLHCEACKTLSSCSFKYCNICLKSYHHEEREHFMEECILPEDAICKILRDVSDHREVSHCTYCHNYVYCKSTHQCRDMKKLESDKYIDLYSTFKINNLPSRRAFIDGRCVICDKRLINNTINEQLTHLSNCIGTLRRGSAEFQARINAKDIQIAKNVYKCANCNLNYAVCKGHCDRNFASVIKNVVMLNGVPTCMRCGYICACMGEPHDY